MSTVNTPRALVHTHSNILEVKKSCRKAQTNDDRGQSSVLLTAGIGEINFICRQKLVNRSWMFMWYAYEVTWLWPTHYASREPQSRRFTYRGCGHKSTVIASSNIHLTFIFVFTVCWHDTSTCSLPLANWFVLSDNAFVSTYVGAYY